METDLSKNGEWIVQCHEKGGLPSEISIINKDWAFSAQFHYGWGEGFKIILYNSRNVGNLARDTFLNMVYPTLISAAESLRDKLNKREIVIENEQSIKELNLKNYKSNLKFLADIASSLDSHSK